MSRRHRCRLALLAGASGVLGAVGAAGPAAADAPAWRLEQPPPPSSTPFKVPLGAPGDLQFFARNRGLLTVEGNSVVPRGIYAYDGLSWHSLASVCGGSGDTARIAFAGPDEFWVVSEPSQPRRGNGTALCHFKDGQVVASYSTAPQSPDPFHTMDSAACNGPSDCWFGGYAAESPDGNSGAFHLHWDGTSLTSTYDPEGRGVSDVAFLGGTFFETSFVGRGPENTADPEVTPPEDTPALIHRIVDGGFANDPFRPSAPSGVPPDGTELLGLGSDGTNLWAVGGGAASGPAADKGVVEHPPVAARLLGGAFQEVPIAASAFGATDRFVDVAPIPGTASAYAAVQRFPDRRSTTAKATVAVIDADGSTRSTRLPAGGGGRGSAARIAFTAPNDGWMVTTAGWLFHYTDGSSVPPDTDPSYKGQITFRPNEAAEQSTPDTPPPDNSQLFAPPPASPPPKVKPRKAKRLPPLLRGVQVSLRREPLTVVLRFRSVRAARIALIARRGGHVVGQTRFALLRAGRHVLRIRVTRKRYPTKLAFKIREKGQKAPGDSNTFVSPGGSAASVPPLR